LPPFGMNGLVVARDQRRARHWRDRHNNGRRRPCGQAGLR
jgi:hypothetical protein